MQPCQAEGNSKETDCLNPTVRSKIKIIPWELLTTGWASCGFRFLLPTYSEKTLKENLTWGGHGLVVSKVTGGEKKFPTSIQSPKNLYRHISNKNKQFTIFKKITKQKKIRHILMPSNKQLFRQILIHCKEKKFGFKKHWENLLPTTLNWLEK